MSQGLVRDKCLAIIGLTKNQYYHRQSQTKSGRRPTQTTLKKDPVSQSVQEVDNGEVVDRIVEMKLNPNLSHWYRNLTCSLQLQGYYINHKKVYRLMEDHQLLEKSIPRLGRNFVKYRRVTPQGPLQVLEMDIKYVWVDEMNRNAYVLTVIDTFTRYALYWSVGYTMQSKQIREAWEYIVAEILQPSGIKDQDVQVEVRSDNGRQFCSKVTQEFFLENKLEQVFTHPYTPEENGHIESFHAILGKAIGNIYFTSLSDLEQKLNAFYKCYNNDRSHSGTIGIPPSKFWALYEKDKIEVIPLKYNRVKFKLKVAYQDVLSIEGINAYDYRELRA